MTGPDAKDMTPRTKRMCPGSPAWLQLPLPGAGGGGVHPARLGAHSGATVGKAGQAGRSHWKVLLEV